MVSQESIVHVWPFTRQQEGSEVIVGRPDTGVFVALSLEAVQILDYLAAGHTVEEAAIASQSSTSELLEFLKSLEDQGLVDLGSERATSSTRRLNGSPIKRYHFSSFPQKRAELIFSFPVLTIALVLVAFGASALLLVPDLRPHARDLYFDRHKTVIWTLLVVVSYGSVVLHEASHVIAAKARGVNSRLGFGNRLWDLVVEADLTGLWSVPKRQRYLPLLAGNLLDAVIASLLLLVLLLQNKSLITLDHLSVQVLRALMFTYVTRVFWQAFLFVRTDYYYVIATFFNCRNLMGDTEGLLRNQMCRLIPWIRPVDQSAIPSKERKVVRAYAFVWLLGRIVAISFLFAVTLPMGRYYFTHLLHAYRLGYSANPADFLDSTLMTFYFVVPIAIGIPIWFASIARRVYKSAR